MDIQPRTLGGRYQLGPTLGRGGMAEVVRARDLRLQRDVAVKQLRVDLASDPTFQERFRREAHSAAGLNHPNIVAVYDTDEERDPATGSVIPYIVMELVEGRTLRQVMNSGDKLTPERAMEITQSVLDALGYSHRAGIVHRDIKPGNVMLTDAGGQVKVMDFGIARAVADTQATMTQTAAVIGTAQYLSPEQARGEKVGFRSDLYSTGCLLYELLTGRPPFIGDSQVSVAYQHVREQPVAPSTLVPSLSPAIDAVLLKSLEKSPDRRYQTARDFSDDLARILAGQQPLALAEGHGVAATTAAAATAVAGASETTLATRAQPAATGGESVLTTSPQRAIVDADGEAAYATQDHAEVERRRHRRRRAWWTVLAVLLSLLLVGGGLWWANQRSRIVTVPDVVTKTQLVAEELMRAEGLEPQVTMVQGPDDATVGQVTAQNPAAGTQTEDGSTVQLTVNAGPEKFSVPEGLVGRDLAAVQQALDDAGFTNVRAVAVESSRPANEVLSIEPAPGSMIEADGQIRLTYASGRVTLPDWNGFNRQAVEASATQLGLTGLTFTEQDSAAEPGTVIGQSPAAGESVARNQAVTVVLARVAQPATVTPTDTTSPGPNGQPSDGTSAQPVGPGGDNTLPPQANDNATRVPGQEKGD